MIYRHCSVLIRERLAHFPAVALLGPRQVGKTTLAKRLAQDGASRYLDLGDPQERRKLVDPSRYLDAYMDELVILDEVHRTPDLFQALRGSIDRGREKGLRTGRFLFLGSASMSLLKQTGESLAGRVAYVELPPVGIMEVDAADRERLWVRGGFPDSFLAKSETQSMLWRNNFIRTYLERDIPDLGPRIPAETLYRFWTMLAHSQGQVLNAAQLAQSLAVAGKTIARYLDLMVDLLLVRKLPPLHANVKKRLVKSPKFYVRDSGVLHALLDIPNHDSLYRYPKLGASWEGFVVDNICAVAPERTLTSFYRTSAGAEIDLVLEFPGLSETWAIEIKSGSAPKPSKGFYNAIEDIGADQAFVVYGGTESFPISDSVSAVGLTEMLRLLSIRHAM